MIRPLFATVLVAGLATGAFAQRAPFPIPDPDPEIERKSFQLAEGFEVNLFAADPMLAKPIQMNWDSAGRLWIAASEIYPQIEPGQVANDKILILEDADGDGKADKTTVFAEGLLIPTGIEPGDGGCYVANSTELVHLRDTDGDGKADERRVLLSGFGTEDTHHILHTFRRGPEGRLYFNQSTYIHSHIETPWGVRRLGGGGIWQFEPASRRLDVNIRGLINPWGHAFDRWGRQFATDGAGNEGINDVVPGASYAWTPGATRVLPGLNPGSPKYCGLEVVSGRHLPEEWQGQWLTNDFRANRVCRFALAPDGSSYSSRELPELIKTSHMAFRPIDVNIGPDGAIYVADWYNPIIQHGEVDFRDPRRDHTRGRIWRVTAKGRPLIDRPKLVGASVPVLLDALKAPEDWTRHHARRVLAESHADTLAPALADWVAKLDRNDPGYEHHRLEALWLGESAGRTEPSFLAELLRSPEPFVRVAAARLVADHQDRFPDATNLFAPLAVDDHPRVRLEAVRALARIPSRAAIEVALKALDRPLDKALDYGLWLAVRDLESTWLPDVRAGRFDFEGRTKHLVFALQAIGTSAALEPLLALIRDDKVSPEDQQGALTLVASVGGPKELALVLAIAADDRPEAGSRRVALLDALIDSQRRRKVRPEGDLAAIVRLLDADADDVRSRAAVAAGLWKLDAVRPKLLALASSPSVSSGLRASACEGLADLGGAEGRAALLGLAGSEQPSATRLAASIALLRIDRPAGADASARWLAEASEGADPTPLFAACREQKESAKALAAALKDRTIPGDAAKLGLRVIRAASNPEASLVEALSSAGKIGRAEPPSAAEVVAMVGEVASRGDAARGETIFRRKDLACMNCHAIAGSGGRVGPDLTSIGASAPVDYLLDSIYLPGKAVKEGYHATVVATADGKVYTGVKVRQDDEQLVLRDADDREVVLPLASVEEQQPAGSIMPAGLVDSLTRGEVVDLVSFLSRLGKVGPYSVGQARLARTWEVLEPTAENAKTLMRPGWDEAARPGATLRWSPAYSLVSGRFPVGELAPLPLRPGDPKVVVIRSRIEVTTPGKVRLKVTPSTTWKMWIDETSVEPAAELSCELATGVHILTFALEVDRVPDGLTLELLDEPGSPARPRFVVGK